MDLSAELAVFISPLATACGSQQQTAMLLRELGIVERRSYAGIAPESISALAQVAGEAVSSLNALADPNLSAGERTAHAIEAARMVMDAIRALDTVAAQGLDDLEYPFDNAETWQTLARALPGYLLSHWLRAHHPIARASLQLIGAIRSNGEGGESLDFDAIGRFATDPSSAVAAVVTGNRFDIWEPLKNIVAALGLAQPARGLRFE